MFDRGLFVVNVSEADGRALEELLAHESPRLSALGGAILDASYATKNPPLLARLRQLGVPYVIDPQSMRFAHPAFREVESIRDLPYAPAEALTADASAVDLRRLVHRCLDFQSKLEVAAYVAPALPFMTPLGTWSDTYRKVHQLAANAVGSEVPERPLLALATPSGAVLKSPYALFSRISDLKIAGIYLQPTALHPKQDSVERLVGYGNFIRCAGEYHLPVLAGRVGAFGLVVATVGDVRYDSGLGQRESFALASLQRSRTKDSKGRTAGGRAKRVYLASLMTTVDEAVAQLILQTKSLRGHYVCDIDACRFAIESQVSRHKAHYLHAMRRQAFDLAGQPTRDMRIEGVRRLIETAADTAAHTNRILGELGYSPLSLDHIRRWHAVLARLSGKRGWRQAS